MFMLKSTHEARIGQIKASLGHRDSPLNVLELVSRLRSDKERAEETCAKAITRAVTAEAKILALETHIAEIEHPPLKPERSVLASIMNTRTETTPGVKRRHSKNDIIAKPIRVSPISGKIGSKKGAK